MSAKLLEISATYIRERMRFPNADCDVVIVDAHANSDINGVVALKGPAEQDELQPDQTYRFYGHWTSYKNKRTGNEEKQFAFQSFVLETPHNREGVVAYLLQAGEGHGFGRVRAAKLWEMFGSDAVKTFREQPDLVIDKLAAHGLPLAEEKALAISAVLASQAALEGCTLDLNDLLAGRGFPKATGRNCVRLWGNRAADLIRKNPYRLMAHRGCGFKRCDALYLDLKLDPTAIRRQGYCLWNTIARDSEGHTWYPHRFVEKGLQGSIAAGQVKFEHAVTFARRLGAVAELRTSGVGGPISPTGTARWFAEAINAKHEADIAQAVADASREPCQWPDVSLLEGIDDHQQAELARAVAGVVGVLGGSPGTGKTYALAALAKYLCRVLGEDEILIGAPTGKAAVRVTENLARYGLPLRARTWHSLLALLERQELKHFPVKVLIGDESSMNDTDLAARIFRARSVGTHVLLVGDVNQLPPVGHGAPLRDLIAAGLPYGELREIKRNSGGIVEACAAIRDGRRWEPGDNLELIETSNPQDQIWHMLQTIREQIPRGVDPVWGCQVVVPVNKKSALSRKDLSKLLQQELNPNPGTAGMPFRVGDKIVNTKNGFFPSIHVDELDEETSINERGEVYVANGELAEVLDVQEKMIVAKLSNPDRTIRIPRGKEVEKETDPNDGEGDDSTGTGCSWDLGYCLSVHKSQGSEWPVVIVMLDDYPGAKMVCSREWLYTAISRAKDRCVMIGKRETADSMCRRIALDKRKTFLREQIHLTRSRDVLADL
jgi:exodeoxyribonuclease V alpha subunit